MLPALSHATSVGRWKLSPGVPAPGAAAAGPPPAAAPPPAPPRPPPAAAPPPRPPPTAATTARSASTTGRCRAGWFRIGLHDGNPRRPRVERQRRHAHHLGLAAEEHLHAPVAVELHHLRRHLIDGPHVVLRIDAHLLRLQHAVAALADLAHELAGLVEHEQPRAAVRDRARCAERDRRIAGPRVDVDVALRIRGDAGGLAEVHAAGIERISVAVNGISGNRQLRGWCGDGSRDSAAPTTRRISRFMIASSTAGRRSSAPVSD